VNREGWERSDFPILCETCLGPNPYIRMTKAQFDKECKICARPFTVFRWQPGGHARYKKTEICQTCAKVKNVCQTCLLDLEFGLPVQVRDQALAVVAPISDVQKEWVAQQNDKAVADGNTLPYNKTEMRAVLQKVARSAPYYKRNMAHVCSFFVKGECKRGSECPYRHELPNEDPDLAKQNIKDRYYGKDDPVAKKLINRMDDFGLKPPLDKEVKTLYLGGINSSFSEQDIRDVFYASGDITEIKLVPRSNSAFLTFANREDAEKAVEKFSAGLVIKEVPIRVAWSKPHIYDPQGPSSSATTATTNAGFFSLPTATPTSGYYAAPLTPTVKPVYPSMNPTRLGAKTDR